MRRVRVRVVVRGVHVVRLGVSRVRVVRRVVGGGVVGRGSVGLMRTRSTTATAASPAAAASVVVVMSAATPRMIAVSMIAPASSSVTRDVNGRFQMIPVPEG